ncbi:asparagine synthase-related protein [Sphingomonas donggukensis]|uniref:asparagine synthase (glutamine-hydrolyzing) n=1 Tax=Sphingomonas donggukensis TaxID=2949093 RepID=A0ABY4TSF1_9SPHN|nr:asparagine synthase-related protein [Sphingomonas donggukensis]URW75326.1 asparagine synthase-related protein [Sphingomonas donggukensis]
MTSLAACLRPGDAASAERLLGAMLVAQQAAATRESAVEGAFAAAAAVVPLLAGGDRSALGTSPCGRWLVAIDARLTNRQTLAATLGVTSTSGRELVLGAFTRWGSEAPSRLSGNFAIIAWDRDAHRLHLIRDPLGQRPLFFRAVAGGYAAASMPAGLAAPFGDPLRPDPGRLCRLLNHRMELDDASHYAGILRVRPGEIVTLAGDAPPRARLYWRPDTDPDSRLTTRDCADAFAGLLPIAVADQVDRGRAVGAHLSAGLDSSAVTALAARATDARILAITAAPADGAPITAPRGRLVDESPLARLVTAGGRVDHHCIAGGDGFASLLDNAHAALAQPMPSPQNYGWVAASFDLLRAHDIAVVLIGQAGNFTFSRDGQPGLRELLRAGRWGGVLRRLLDPAQIGARLAQVQQRLASRGSEADRAARWTLARTIIDDPATPLAPPEHSLAILQGMDPGALLRSFFTRWGIDMRDPTADQRLVELALRIPTSALRSGSLDRAPARLSLGGIVPDAVRLNRRRGYQSSDWLDRMTRERSLIAQEVAALGRSAVAQDIIDVPRLRRLVEDWPTDMRYTPDVERVYRHVVPQAITIAGWARRVAGE